MAKYADLLIITHESVGEKMAGPGIRYWEISRALGSQGVKVTLGTPLPSTRTAPGVEVRQFIWEDAQTLEDLIANHQVVLSNGPVLARVVHVLGHPIEKPTIVDIYYSPEIEQMMLNLTMNREISVLDAAALDDLHAYLRQGDLFICATQKQYDFWSGALLAVGRLNSRTVGKEYTIDHFLRIVPMGLPEHPPVPGNRVLKGIIPGIGEEDKVIFWGGGIWDWTDPITLLKAFKIVHQDRENIRLVFGTLHHYEKKIVPHMSVADRMLDYINREGWRDRYVFFLDWIPYDQRGSYLLEVDIGVSLTLDTIENRYAARARLMDYLWTGLPCVISAGDEIAEILHRSGLAKIVSPGDVVGVTQALLSILEISQNENRTQLHHSPLIHQLSWTAVVKPILEFLESPALAADAVPARAVLRNQIPLRKAWEELRGENIALRHQLEMFQQRRSTRLINFINRLIGRTGGIELIITLTLMLFQKFV